MNKEVELPPLDDTFGLGAGPVADALRQRESQLAKQIERNDRLDAELDRGDSWVWIREKFERCRTQFAWYKPRTDRLVGTRYEVMGWLHVLFSHADPKVYIDITMEHQERCHRAEERAEKAETELAALTVQVEDYEEVNREKKRLARLIDVAMHGEADAAPQASLCDLVSLALALRLRAEAAEAELAALREGAKELFVSGQRVIVNHPRYRGKGIVRYDTGERKRVVGVLIPNGNIWEYESDTVTLDDSILDTNEEVQNEVQL